MCLGKCRTVIGLSCPFSDQCFCSSLSLAAFHCQETSCFLCAWGRELSTFWNVCRASPHDRPGPQSSLRQRSGTETVYHSVKCRSRDKEKFLYSRSLCCRRKMGFYSLLTRFSWKLTASSQAPPYFGAGPHCGTYSWLHVPPDTVCSKKFFRDCSNGLQFVVKWF